MQHYSRLAVQLAKARTGLARAAGSSGIATSIRRSGLGRSPRRSSTISHAPALVLADPPLGNGRRPRRCAWGERLDGLIAPEVTSISELIARQRVPRLYEHKLVIVNWDACNGDATTSSDLTLGFFRDLGRLRR